MDTINTEKEVIDRYADASEVVQPALCCAVDYDPKVLKVIPQEIIDKDYGCGDPSQYVQEGDVVVDLGSGGGKICYIASQLVGPKGRVIGVDFNPAMLELARRHQADIAEKIGWDNVTFKYGKIQDLATDYAAIDERLKKIPVSNAADYHALEQFKANQIATEPMIADNSVDVIVSNCVLNLVRTEEKSDLFAEMYRVLKRGGRVAISDIVSDEVVPEHLQNDPELWSGCISGAYQEQDFLKAFEEAGFYGIEVVKRDTDPWQVVEGIEFRSVTIRAYKGKDGECLERNQAVIYKGPWKEVLDDDGHRYQRGVPTAVCDKTCTIMSKEPYKDQMISVAPAVDIPLEEAKEFDCSRNQIRRPAELKGASYYNDDSSGSCC